MRGIDTPVRQRRRRVFKEVANLAYNSKNLKDDSAVYMKSWLESLKESPSFIKTSLMDVKRATSVITQRIDEVALELEAKQSQTNDKSVSMDAEAKVEKPQQEVPKPELEEVVARSAWHR